MNNAIIFIFGASIGSFLNVLIDRLPKEEGINGRSHCDFCGKKIAWYDLIPVVSFFVLRGKSRCCHKNLSWQYPIVEVIMGMVFVLILSFRPFLDSSTSLPSVASLGMTLGLIGIVSSLIVIFFSDLKYHLISDYILLALFMFSVLFQLTELRVGHARPLQFVSVFIPSGLVVSFPIWLIYFISKERAMGLGDVYLTAIMGFLLGWQKGFLALYIAFVTGAIFGLILMILHKKRLKSKIPFGPFLVIGTLIMLFYGEKIFGMIGKIYGF